MKVYHRLIGDPPKRGFGNVIGSAGFPNGAAWADNKNTVRLPGSVPFGLTEKAENGLIENHEAYEYQTLRFGQVALLRSVQGTSVVNGQYSRPHSYTHIAAMMGDDEGNVITDYAEPCQLLGYDDFLTLREFWELPADKDTIPPTDWQPPAKDSSGFGWKAGLSNELLAALIARYWKAATRRMFDNPKDLHPVEVCLNDETNCKALIGHAKNFFAALIIPYLPRPVLNILSMSVAVPKMSIQMFSPTALVFLYPEKEIAPNDQLFDLRTGRFKNLSPDEAAFAASLISGAGSQILRDVFGLYKKEKGCQDPEHCTFMADYDVAFAVDRIENNRIDPKAKPEELLKLWRDLTIILNARHGIGPELCHVILSPISKKILSQLTEGTASAISMDKGFLSFLFQELALYSGFDQENQIIELICRHQSARLKPFFLEAIQLKEYPGIADRLTLAAARILCECFVKSLPNEEEMLKLTEPGFIDTSKRFEQTKDKMADYILQALDRNPESETYLLPLSKHFVDGFGRLKQAINLMNRNYVTTRPSDAACSNLKLAIREYGNDENRALLAEYLEKYFWAHREDMNEFDRAARLTGADMAQVLLKIFSEAAGTDHMDEPVTALQLDRLLKLLPREADKPALKAAMLEYVLKVLEYSLNAGTDSFAWLCKLDQNGALLDFPTRLDLCLNYAPAYIKRLMQPLPEWEFDMLLKLLTNAGNVFAGYETPFLEAFDSLQDAGADQVIRLLDYFTSFGQYPYIRSAFLRRVKNLLAFNWQNTQNYWNPVDEICQILPKGGVARDEVLDDETRKNAKETLSYIFRGMETIEQFEAELEANGQRTSDVFSDLWLSELRDTFKKWYPSYLAAGCQSREDIRQLEQFRQTLGTTFDETNTKAVFCAKIVLESWDFMENMDKINVYQCIQDIQKLRERLSQCKGQGCRQPLHLLKHHFVDSDALNECSYMGKVAAGLLCTAWEDADSAVVTVLRLVGRWDKKTVSKPYEGKGLDNLWAVSILFVSLEMFDPNLPQTLLDHLFGDDDFKRYSDNVRGNRRMMNSFYPWLSDRMHNFIPDPHHSLKSWLS